MYKISVFVLLFFFQLLSAQDLPLGYVKYFEANFTKEKLDKQFLISDHTSTELINNIWYAEEKVDTMNSFMPPAVLLVDNHVLGDFIADVSLNFTTHQTDSLSGIFIITGLRDSTNYYFIKIGAEGAAFYKMYRGQISLIDSDSAFVLKEQSWQNMRITRDILKRTIHLETKSHQVKFTDPNLVMGYLGLGVIKYTLALKSFIIWAPTAISRPASIFR